MRCTLALVKLNLIDYGQTAVFIKVTATSCITFSSLKTQYNEFYRVEYK